MKNKNIKKWMVAGLVAVGLPILSATTTFAQDGKAAGAATNSVTTDTENSEQQLTNREVNQAIRQNFRVNSPFSGNSLLRNRSNSSLNNNFLQLDLGPNYTYDALGNSPVNNNSGAYNTHRAVNMPQSSITQPPLPYKNGGTYYQANDSLMRPPTKGF